MVEIFLLVVFFCGNVCVFGTEPLCNKFSYDELLLEKLVRLEFKVEKTREKFFNEVDRIENKIRAHKGDTRTLVLEAKQELSLAIDTKTDNLSSELVNVKDEISSLLDRLSVTYIRWGRTKCPDNANLVYEGYASGSHYQYSGGSSDTVCLPKEPQYGKKLDGQGKSPIYNVEYQGVAQTQAIFGQNMEDKDVPCAVCETRRRSAILMIPARLECYPGWHLEYYGYLMTSHRIQKRVNMKCVDVSPEGIPGQDANVNGDLLYFVEVAGAIPNPPYTKGSELTCVVCSK